MNQIQEYRNPILIGVGALVVAIVLWLAWVSPQSSHLNTLNQKKQALQTRESSLNSQLVTLKAEQQKIPSKCAQLQKIDTQIPSVQNQADLTAEEASFNTQLTNLVTSSGVAIPSTKVGGATATAASSTTTKSSLPSGITAIPASMTVTGDFQQMSAFISGLDNPAIFPRLYVIQTFQLSYGNNASSSGTPSGVIGNPPLWVGQQPSAGSAGPYTLDLTGNIYYTSAKSPIAACAKAQALKK